MRPEDGKALTAARGVARAKMFLNAHLGWLEGYPESRLAQDGEIAWRLADGKRVAVGRVALREANVTLRRLCRYFPRALPRVVGKVDPWRARVAVRLQLLSRAVHEGAELPASLFDEPGCFSAATSAEAKALNTTHPEVGDFSNAISWAACGNDRDARSALRFAAHHASPLTVLGSELDAGEALEVAWALGSLHRRDGSRCDALVRALGDARAHTVATNGPGDSLGSSPLRRELETAIRRVPLLSRELIAFLQWLLRQDKGPRRRALKLFELSWPAATLAAWDAWWQEACATAPRAVNHGAPPPEESLQRLVARLPLALVGSPWLGAVRAVAAIDRPELQNAIGRALKAIDAADAMPWPALLLVWASTRLRLGARSGQLVPWMDALVGFLRDERFAPFWLESWATGDWDDSFPDWLDRAQAHFGALAVCLASRGSKLDEDESDALEDIVDHANPAGEAATAFLSLSRKAVEGFIPSPLLRATIGADACDLESFTAVAEGWIRRDIWSELDGLTAAVEQFRRAENLPTLVGLLRSGRLRRIAERGARCKALGVEAAPLPAWPAIEETPPAWAARYPPALHLALARLASVHPAAEAAAQRKLDGAFPSPDRLRREIASLEKRVVAGPERLRTRLENLRARLESPSPPSPRRIEKLRDALLRSADRALLDHWAAQCEAVELAVLAHETDVATLPDWLCNEEMAATFRAIGDLEKADRALAHQVLRARAGAPPWDLRDHAQNREQIARWRARGLDPGPWIDTDDPARTQGANGRDVWLSLADDPLDVMRMGAHFRTCLSPGDFNFFSAFANAADINKRVLYARDDRGNVVGRCLLALTDEGNILPFHPYCHDPGLDFDALCAGFAGNLATRIGGRLAGRHGGHVPTLVAHRWYDDGVVDLVGEFPALREGSEFRAGLAAVDLDDFTRMASEALGCERLGEREVARLVALPEIEARPVLVAPLLDVVEDADVRDEEILRHVAYHVSSITVPRAAGVRLARRLVRWPPAWSYAVDRLIVTIAELDPGSALRLLRRTRGRSQRRKAPERTLSRAYASAIAFDALGRPRKALAAYRRALELGASQNAASRCHRRIEQLGAVHQG